MFTGIIEALGTISSVESVAGDIRLTIHTGSLDLADVKLGDSIATNGVCLTVVGLTGSGFVADVSRESLAHTRIGEWQSGTRVNLEKALLPTTRLGGHMVSGHVDGVGKVISRQADARSIRFEVEAPQELRRYIAAKGSITVDGVSLTANDLTSNGFTLNIVPHTAAETTLISIQAGDQVHLEVDMIARYLEQLLTPRNGESKSNITTAFLAEHGFMNRSR
ncbi:riboflavin synthase [Oceanobacter mangrovi]|uniref:riboflavin synthase n=1 Tax=Oceanobacter mangrovi TaxID=2862510 RepID=UPI001C8E1875|nr:riboflavin synthase [Oceanobacter mangrovi]